LPPGDSFGLAARSSRALLMLDQHYPNGGERVNAVQLIGLAPEWYEGEVAISFLDGMRFFNLPPWVSKVPSLQFADLALSRQRPAMNEAEFCGFATAIERPIAVAPSLEGPFCLLEGYTRCACILRDHRTGLSSLARLPMIVAVTSRIVEWSDEHGHLWW